MIRKALTLLAPNGLLITANVIQYGRLTREGAGTTFKVSIDRLVPSRIVLFERFLHSSFKFETKKNLLQNLFDFFLFFLSGRIRLARSNRLDYKYPQALDVTGGESRSKAISTTSTSRRQSVPLN